MMDMIQSGKSLAFPGLPGLRILISLLLFSFLSCKPKVPVSSPSPEQNPPVKSRFTLLEPSVTGVDFSNDLVEDYTYNIYVYEYMYNGGGVAIGDVNGDSLPDIYFSTFHSRNRLYLNQGQMKFVEVTDISGVSATEGYKTGVTMADINGDGRLDIYSCRTSKNEDGLKNDFLFINTGNRLENGIQVPIFEDQSKKLGVADNSNTNHASFFDYDRDGDLDLFLLNHRGDFETATQMRLIQNDDGTRTRMTAPQTPFESNLLYRNDNGRFTDVTAKAGLVSSAFGLSATPADINGDGWLDLYVANDYIDPDFIYINNRNGTFTDHYKDYLKHSSQSSMGSDIIDIDNDGLVDFVVLDMKPEDPFRYKEMMNTMVYDRYNLLVQNDYGRQASRNVLQLNNGNGTYSEIGQYAGIAATDWSWAVVAADFDNDGWKDLFVSNGYRKDVNQLEYLNFFRDSISRGGGFNSDQFPDINDFLKYLPEQKLANYLFINNTQLGFINATKAAGMDQLSFSNGVAYGDLDRDGDLDLVVSNIDQEAFVYRNDISDENWLQIDLQDVKGNIEAIGAYVDIYCGPVHQYQMMLTTHGFLSTSEPLLHFGLGTASVVDSIILHWPDGKAEMMEKVPANQRLHWKRGQAKPYTVKQKVKFSPLFEKSTDAIQWSHADNEFVDSKRERLIPYNLSSEGPCLAVGDINGDQLEDIYVGNGRGFPSAVLIQSKTGKFSAYPELEIRNDSLFEDCAAVLEDFDGDQDLDLMVVSGGNDLPQNDPNYMTRYYLNDGQGNFKRQIRFPLVRTNGGSVLAFDFDNDQDKDLFIGGRCTPGQFPKSPKSFLLLNDKGNFRDVTKETFPEFDEIGMVTDLQQGDLDGDGRGELVIAGDWMPIQIFSYDGKKFINQTAQYGLEKTNGWWRSLLVSDVDEDGDLDLLCGNIGMNHRFTTSTEYPITLVTHDFDGNGSLDPIMCFYYQEKLYPFASRDAIIGQIPSLKKKFTRYTAYASASLNDIFSKSDLEAGSYLYVHTLKTTLFKNENKKFNPVELPYQVQLSPVNGMLLEDVNHDGRKDIVMAGNFNFSDTETGEMNAGNGTLLLQQQDGSFIFVSNREHGFWAQKDTRDLKAIKLSGGMNAILTGNNRGPLELSVQHSPVE